MPPKVINLQQKLNLFDDLWSPKIVAAFEGFQFRLAKAEGDFVWHCHEDTEEVFLMVAGEMRVDFRDGSVTLRPGEMLVIPRGVEHKPFAENECHVMTLSRAGEVNTGNAPTGERTAESDQWI